MASKPVSEPATAGSIPGSTKNESTESVPVLERLDVDGIAHLTLNRPDKFNTLNEELLGSLQSELELIGTQAQVRVVVLGASGRAFCAGHDLREMSNTANQDYYNDLFSRCSTFMQSVINLPQPVIARVEGMATAAGCQLVATCDMAVASEDATFAVSGINLGLFCSTPSVALSRNIPRKRAFEMLFTGEFIDAWQAREWGLINQCVPASKMDETIATLCATISAKPASTVRTGKRMFYKQIEKNISEAYSYAGQTMACNMMDKDTVEGVSAFLEKREPDWKS